MINIGGESTKGAYIYKKRDYYSDLIINALIIAAVVVGIVFGMYVSHAINVWTYVISVIILAAAISILAKIQFKELGHFQSGIRAEERAYVELEFNLSNDYFCARNVVIPGKKGDVDIIVWGPTGVFALEVKSFEGNLKVEGDEIKFWHPFKGYNDPIKQARGSAFNTCNYLKKNGVTINWVDAILAFPGHGDSYKGEISNLTICRSHEIVSKILAGQHKLNHEEIQKISEVFKELKNNGNKS